ncbi:conserved Plasmodium protein, unknown function [Plasmodium ovale curtisi]|uniref:Uncharacterized protein n=2 Tax=Plasmodium ovale TaxID=36330 RepID=A0A1A8VP46_PLAOA|nr:conserved Plasmodium protein, unknown function [Plasmodium ovale curtisi]
MNEREGEKERESKRKEEKGRERKRKEEKGRERKRKEEKGRERKRKEEKGRERKRKEEKGRERKRKEEKGRERKRGLKKKKKLPHKGLPLPNAEAPIKRKKSMKIIELSTCDVDALRHVQVDRAVGDTVNPVGEDLSASSPYANAVHDNEKGKEKSPKCISNASENDPLNDGEEANLQEANEDTSPPFDTKQGAISTEEKGERDDDSEDLPCRTQKGVSQKIKQEKRESPKGESQTGESPKGESQTGESPKGESQMGESPKGESQTGKSQMGESKKRGNMPPSRDSTPPTSQHPERKSIDDLKIEIKKKLYQKLCIALDVNMYFHTGEKYYMRFVKDITFRKYILKLSQFVIILGKHLHLSMCTISMALYYMHKYNQKVLRRKRGSIFYLLAGACIFLAWKIREDYEDIKKSRKLFDVPKSIFKLVNYFYKKKKLKRKIKQIELDIVTSKEDTYQVNDEDTFNVFMERVRREEILNGRGKGESNKKKNLGVNNLGRKIGRNGNPRGKCTQGEKTPEWGVNVREKRKMGKETERKGLLYEDLLDVKRIIAGGYVSDINNISNIDNYFNSYLSECNSRDISEYEFVNTSCEKPIHVNEDKNIVEEVEAFDVSIMKKRKFMKFLKRLCKRQKQNIDISASKWVLNNSGQKLQLMQKVMIYYEGEILKSINYFIKPKNLSFELLPSVIGKFVLLMKDNIHESQEGHLEKLTFLTIMDLYKTPLCLMFSTKEIIISCILRAYISLKLIYDQLDTTISSLAEFEGKAKLFIQSFGEDDPIQVNRIKAALREFRYLYS